MEKRKRRALTSPLCLLLEHTDANRLRLVVPLHLKQRGYPAIMALEQQKQTDWLVLAGHRGMSWRTAKHSTQEMCACTH